LIHSLTFYFSFPALYYTSNCGLGSVLLILAQKVRRLKLFMDDKKEIVLYELKKRSRKFQMESITSFIHRLLCKYHYSKGSERYFWYTIKELEEEGKVRRYRNGKRKIIFPVKENNFERKDKQLIALEQRAIEKRLNIIKDFLSSWEV